MVVLREYIAWIGGMRMLTIVVAMILAVYCMPLFGIYLMLSRKQDENRLLGAVVTVLGLVVWGIFGLF